MQRKPSLRSILLLLFCCGIASVPAAFLAPSYAHAQDVEEEEQEELEDEEDEATDEDEEDGDEGGLGELMWVRRMLGGRLEDLNDKVERTKDRIRQLDKFIAVSKKTAALEEQIAIAEERGDDAAAKKLTEQFERLETEIGLREEMMELEFELEEATENLEEAEREEEDDRIELLEVVVDGLRTSAAISAELLPLKLDGKDSEAEPLEVRKALILTNQVEKPFRALRTLEELYDAEETEDEEAIEELSKKLDKLRSDISSFMERGETSEDPSEQTKAAVPQLQPIVVNEQTLAQFANLDLHRDVAPLLKTYCFDCHSNDESSGELNFEQLLATSPIVRKRDQWVNVIEQAKNHVMPPEDAEQPSDDERKKIVLALHNAIYNFDYSEIDDPGFESAKRLTHREYSNTVRDLFGIDIDVVDRFPDDLTATSGFDNSANSLFIQPLLMERYIGIAEHVVNTALPDKPTTAEQRNAHARIFGKVVDRSAIKTVGSRSEPRPSAREVMGAFLTRAYRRPAKQAELDRFSQQIERGVTSGQSFEEAVKATIQTVLITPSFLLRSESNPATDEKFAIDDWELASRLSYFLWASMPDDKLLELAKSKKLRDPVVLSKQVDRMIADEKSNSLGTNFAAQWLGSQHLGVRMRLDPIDNPWCTETLMAAMRDETSMFFNTLIRENRPVTEMVNADYTFLNAELAKLYRIKGVEGDEMRRVSLKTDKRGGIFGQGSLLAVTSFPGRTSPVVRGKWILDTVLGTPPPPPPPNVSELSEEIEGKRRLSFREKLELHREKPNCYACHSQMDPLGFSLENFDWFGRYRTRRGRGRIDSKGKLPNGTEFAGLAGLKKVVVEERRDDLIRQLTQKLLSYGLGRQLEYYDEPAIRKILSQVDQTEGSGGEATMQQLIHAIVESDPFQYKKIRRDAEMPNPKTAKTQAPNSKTASTKP